MKLTAKQQLDLRTVLYYATGDTAPTDDDIRAYFAWSDRGDKSFLTMRTAGAERLRYGKQYRDLQVTSYKEDWGLYITAADLAEEPEFICRWLSRVMNKPGIYSMWKMFNNPSALDNEDLILLEPMAKMVGLELAWEYTQQSSNAILQPIGS